MKKHQTFLLILLFTPFLLFSQQPECFSWNEVRINSNNSRNFVSPVQKQTIQNPCISYAFTSVIETKYNIEFNNSDPNTVPLAVAYLDVKINSANMASYKQTLQNHGFKIPSKKGSPNPLQFRYSEFIPNVDSVNPNVQDLDGTYNGFYSEYTNTCIDNEKHFIIKNSGSESSQYWEIDVANCDTESILSGDYLSVSDVTKLNPNSIDILKEQIIENGPLVMKVSGSVLSNFKDDYNETVNYHAYSIIGWDNVDNNNTKWRLTDSWSGEENILLSDTISNSSFMSFINNDDIEIYSVNGVKFKGNSSNNPFNVNTSIQCNDLEPLPSLSSINVDIDYAFIGGYLYHKFWVTSNEGIDSWTWGIDYPNGSLKRSQVNTSNYSSVLLSPTTSGTVTVYVNAYKNGVKVTKERIIYLSNGQSSGGGW